MKYLISEACARSVRDFVSSYLELDEHADPNQPHSAYRITSLYLDNPALELHEQTVQGMKNRFKLRIRFYDDLPSSPVFMEIKARDTDVIRKQRAAVTWEGVRCFLEGRMPSSSHLFAQNGDPTDRSAAALQRFVDLARTAGARGVAYASYMREAYVSPDSDQIRITFDRQLTGAPFDPLKGLAMPRDGVAPKMDRVILELKFTDRFPHWMRVLTQNHNLQRCSVPKYCHCIRALGYRPGQLHFMGKGVI